MYLSLNAFQFHSQIPKIYTFQTWYSLSLCHSFLCLGSPCHPIANAKPNGFNTMPTALSKSCSEYQNIMTHLAYEHVNNSFFIHCYYYYRYSALGPVWAETRVQSGEWYGSGMLHPGQVIRGSLPLLSPAFRRSHFCHQVPPHPPRRKRSQWQRMELWARMFPVILPK